MQDEIYYGETHFGRRERVGINTLAAAIARPSTTQGGRGYQSTSNGGPFDKEDGRYCVREEL